MSNTAPAPLLRVALAQINTRVSDIEGNLAKALAAHQRAGEAGAGLVLLPEMTIPGYPAKDLLLEKPFIRRNVEALERFARETHQGPATLIGFAEPHSEEGNGLYNSAAFCHGGKVRGVYRKWLLPTYDVFDEDRYFDEGRDCCVVEHFGWRLGITVCEDAWNDEHYFPHRRYRRNPVMETVGAGAEVVLNLSASPFAMERARGREGVLAGGAGRQGVPFLMTNLCGANDDVIFDGRSFASDSAGRACGRAASFAEDMVAVELRRTADAIEVSSTEAPSPAGMEELRQALVLGIRDYMEKCGFREVLIGLSGGIDSALVAALAAEALGPERVRGIYMPSRYSSDHSRSDAYALARALGIRLDTIPIEGMFTRVMDDLAAHLPENAGDVTEENAQSRLRGLTLMALSNATGAMVLATGNKSELSVGYATLYGDMCGGLAAIGDVPKLLVYQLSRHLNRAAGREIIPDSTITKPPSAELRPDQKDTDSLPPYEVLDPIIRAYVEEGLDAEDITARGFERETVEEVLRLIRKNEYKRRQTPPTLKVTNRAFGYGWRMPIARGNW